MIIKWLLSTQSKSQLSVTCIKFENDKTTCLNKTSPNCRKASN